METFPDRETWIWPRWAQTGVTGGCPEIMLNEPDIWKCKYVPKAPEVRDICFLPPKGLCEGDYVKDFDREIMWRLGVRICLLFYQLRLQVLQTSSVREL